MAKLIKITPDYINECRTAFESVLSSTKLSDGKLSFSRVFSLKDCKATLYFSEIAWLKMTTLIREFSDEVAWHGVAYRGDTEGTHEYLISDIMVYPQVVTGTNVNTDQVKYQNWLIDQPIEIFNNIRFQGHSHVNMPVSPSGTDLEHQEKILEQLEDDMFYIFMIWNKSHHFNCKIYDMQKNILFETADVNVQVLGLSNFVANAKSMVEHRTTTYNYQNQYGKQTGTPPQSGSVNASKGMSVYEGKSDNKDSKAGDGKKSEEKRSEKEKGDKKKTTIKEGGYAGVEEDIYDGLDLDLVNDPYYSSYNLPWQYT